MDYLKQYQRHLGLTPDGIIGPKSAAAMMEDLGIADKVYFCHLLGQVKHESALYTNFRENLNYSEAGLLNIFRKYYKNHPALVAAHARHPAKIANYVYANRNGNGPESSGDGWFYRGAFGLQLTGKDNFLAFFEYAGLPAGTDPDTLEGNPRMYFLAGKFWFEDNRADKLCTSTSDRCITRVSKAVNLGSANSEGTPHGLAQRLQYTKELFKTARLL